MINIYHGSHPTLNIEQRSTSQRKIYVLPLRSLNYLYKKYVMPMDKMLSVYTHGWLIGSGENIRMWCDSWLQNKTVRAPWFIYQPVSDFDVISNFFVNGTKRWDINLLVNHVVPLHFGYDFAYTSVRLY